jgi:hypothetical protein
MAKHLNKLRSLFLGGFGTFMHFDRLSPEALLHLLSELPHLEYLGLHFNRLFTSEHILALAKVTPKIRFLDFSCPGSFSTESMATLIQNLPDLQYLRIPRDLLASLLGNKKEQEIFPQLRLVLTKEDSIGFPDQLLRNWSLPTNEL